MNDFVHYNALYDLYKEMLTERQRQVFEDYFFENLTVDEIAENDGVSKSSVAKTIKQTKKSLEDLENKLHFLCYMEKIKSEFKNEEELLNRIMKYDNIVI